MGTQQAPNEELLDVLVAERALTRASADAVLARLRDTWVPLGRILRQRGWLTMNQLVELLQLQGRMPGVRLGELALREGYCTAEQVQEALQVQRDLSPHVLEIVAASEGVEVAALVRAVTRYVRTLEKRLSEPRSEVG